MYKKTIKQLIEIYRHANDADTELDVLLEISRRLGNTVAGLERAETSSDAEQICRRFLEPENGDFTYA